MLLVCLLLPSHFLLAFRETEYGIMALFIDLLLLVIYFARYRGRGKIVQLLDGVGKSRE